VRVMAPVVRAGDLARIEAPARLRVDLVAEPLQFAEEAGERFGCVFVDAELRTGGGRGDGGDLLRSGWPRNAGSGRRAAGSPRLPSAQGGGRGTRVALEELLQIATEDLPNRCVRHSDVDHVGAGAGRELQRDGGVGSARHAWSGRGRVLVDRNDAAA